MEEVESTRSRKPDRITNNLAGASLILNACGFVIELASDNRTLNGSLTWVGFGIVSAIAVKLTS